MPKAKVFAILTLMTVLFTIPVITGCGKVAEYADPITENILVSLNNADYAAFSEDFDETMKSELTEESFPDILAGVISQVGKYIKSSKKIVGVSVANGITTAQYTADFENVEKVNVEISFKEVDGQNKVVGLWFK